MPPHSEGPSGFWGVKRGLRTSLKRYLDPLGQFNLEPKTGLVCGPIRAPRKVAGWTILGVDSPFFSSIVLFNNQLFSQGFWWFPRKKDPWKEWGSNP